MTTLVPATYGHNKAFVLSRLTALFHSFEPSSFAEFINGEEYRTGIAPGVTAKVSTPKGVAGK